jgi:hypothetical protein
MEGQMKSSDGHGKDLERRFDDVGWGLLFLLFAALALPSGTAEYASAAIVGGLMLGLNAARVAVDVEVRWFSVVLGAAMLVGGAGALGGVHMDVFMLFFGILGAITILSAVVRPGRAAVAG